MKKHNQTMLGVIIVIVMIIVMTVMRLMRKLDEQCSLARWSFPLPPLMRVKALYLASVILDVNPYSKKTKVTPFLSGEGLQCHDMFRICLQPLKGPHLSFPEET